MKYFLANIIGQISYVKYVGELFTNLKKKKQKICNNEKRLVKILKKLLDCVGQFTNNKFFKLF